MAFGTLLSGKTRRKTADQLDSNRYDFLTIDQAEPNFGVPDSDNSFILSDADGTRKFSRAIQQIRGYFSAGGDLTYDSATGQYSIDVEQIYTSENFDSDLDAAIRGGFGLNYDSATNSINIDSAELALYFSTDNITEGSNLYYTTLRHDSDFDVRLSTKTTTDLLEGDNLYYTRNRFDSALGDTTSISTIRGYFSGQGDLTYDSATGIFSFDVEDVYTQANFDSDFNTSLDAAAIDGIGLTYDASTNTLSIDSAELAANYSTNDITEGNNLYYTTARHDSDFDAKIVEDTTKLAIRSYFTGTGDLSYNSLTGEFSIDVEQVYTKENFDSDLGAAVTGGTGITYSSDSNVISITDTGVNPQAYGTSTEIPQLTINAQGQVTLAETVDVNGISDVSYNDSTGVLTITVPEGSTYSDSITLQPFTTTDLLEGDNLYYTTSRHDSDTLLQVDSDYVQLRQDYAYSSLTGAPTNVSDFANDANYLDSTTVIDVIDSAHVQLRQDYAYSSLTGAPTNVSDFANDANYLDSNTVIDVIDSAHVQLRQDYAYSSLTGAPTNVSDFANDANYLDSTTVLEVVDSAYIKTVDYLDNEVLSFGDGGDLQIYHDAVANSSYIVDQGGGRLRFRSNPGVTIQQNANTEKMAEFEANGPVDLYYDGVKKFETTASGINITGEVVADSATFNGAVTGDSFSVGEIAFRTDFTDSHIDFQEGALWYDPLHKNLNYYTDFDHPIEIGMQVVERCYNDNAYTINKGQPLYYSGNRTDETGQESPTVALANATSSTKYNVQGLAAEDIPPNSYGQIVVAGVIDGFDTSALTAGLNFFAGLTDGAVQNAPPTYPNYPMCLGWVIKSDATDGKVIINQQNHSVNSFRVQGNTHISANLVIDGDLTVAGTQTITSTENVQIGGNIQYLNAGNTIGEAGTTFVGSGLDDAFFAGHYNGDSSTKNFYVEIDSAGPTDTFEWGFDSLGTPEATGIVITGAEQELAAGIKIDFGATTGHTLGDKWTGKAIALNTDTGLFSNKNEGDAGNGYTHVGMYWDASEDEWTFVGQYDSEPEAPIDRTSPTFQYGDVRGKDFYGTTFSGALSGNATTATRLQSAQNFSLTGDITANAVSFDGTGAVQLTTAYNPGSIVNDDINASAGIVDTKLATISTAGKVSNSATTATSANTASAIVARDASGNFSASKATLTDLSVINSNDTTVNFGNSGDANDGVLFRIRKGAFTQSRLQFTRTNDTHLDFELKVDSSEDVNFNYGQGNVANDIFFRRGSSLTPVQKLDANGNISFYNDSGNSQNFYWDASTSRLGLGTTSPSTLLHLDGGTIRVQQTNFADYKANQLYVGGGGYGLAVNGNITFSDQNNNTVMTVDNANDRVGIGTTSPQDILHLKAASPVLRIENSSTSGAGSIEFWDAQGGTSQQAMIRYDDNNNLFEIQGNANGTVFRTPSNTFPASTEAMRLDASGNLLVGKTSTTYNTEGARLSAGGHVTRSGDTVFAFNRTSSDGSIVNFAKDGSTVGSIGVSSSDLLIDGNSDRTGLAFRQYGEITPRRNGALANGTVNLGSPSYRFRNLYLTGTTVDSTGVTSTQFTGPLSGTASNASLFNNEAPSYYLDYDNFTNIPFTLDSATVTVLVDSDLRFNGFTLRDAVTGNFGTDEDLSIYHDNVNAYIDNDKGHIYIRNNVDDDDGSNIYIQAKSGENGIIVFDDGAVSLYHNNNQRFITADSGAFVTGTLTADTLSGSLDYSNLTNVPTFLDSDTVLEFLSDLDSAEVNSIIDARVDKTFVDNLGVNAATADSATIATTALTADTLGGIANSQFVRSDAADVKTSGNLRFNDNVKATFGSDDDLQIYHTGSASIISENSTGNLDLQGSNVSILSGTSEQMAYFTANGPVNLYYDANKKFETTADGVNITGNIVIGSGDTVTLDGDEATVSSTSQTSIAEFPHATYGGAKFIVTATQSSKRQITELLVTHDGTTAYATEYGTIATDSDLATFDVDISGSDVRLLATGTSATTTTYKVVETLIEA